MPIEANISPQGDTARQTKLDQLKKHIARGDMRAAILLAAKFQQLGDARNAILSAREAYLRPGFQKQLGRDPKALITAGIDALRRRYNV